MAMTSSYSACIPEVLYHSQQTYNTWSFENNRQWACQCIFSMDEDALRGLSPAADPQAQARALQYFEQLKSANDGWKICAESFMNPHYSSNDHVRFFCLQVVEHFLKERYINVNMEDQQMIRNMIGQYLQLQGSSGGSDRSFIRNKMGQVISLAFIVDYPHRWPSFFSDLSQALTPSPQLVDIYLRIFLAIDSEVVDRDIVHTSQEIQRNTLIKDTMRDQCIPQLVDTWYQIMITYQTTNPEVCCMCLEVVGKYVSWIDINLIANDKVVTALLRFMSQPLLRESACDCILDIINKGMDSIAKTKLVESFTSVLESQGILSPPEDEEGDFMAKLSKLINGIGVNLILSWQKLSKTGDTEATEIALQALENKVPLMFRFLGDEDDDVSSGVTQFSQDYIALLKQMKPISQKQRQNMEGLLYTVIKKMKYDESYNFEHEGEEEAMFQEYRKQLKTTFTNLAALDSDLVLLTVHTCVTQTLPHWEKGEVCDIEIAIFLLYTLGEALPASQGQHFSGQSNKVTALQEMMRLLVTSRVSCQGHTAVVLQFFETVVRYDKFFNCEPQHIPDIVMAFTDERGFRHPSSQVRSRTSYLFSRFVKSLRSHMQPFLEDILKRIQGLLVINTPDNGYQQLMSGEDQLFLYETAGSLIVSSTLPPEKKQELMKQLLSPIATKFEGLLAKFVAETDEQRKLAYAHSINMSTALASRVSKGFSNSQTMQLCGCVDTFTDLLRIFLQALNAPTHRQQIQTGVRQYLHRMVVCMEKEILPFVPVVMENLLKKPDAKELHDFIPLMNQLIMKFKRDISPFLQKVFMPLVQAIYHALTTPADALDQETAEERKMLRRSYFLFLSTLVSNNSVDVLGNQDMQNLHDVLVTIVQGAVDLPDPQSQKMCFSILRKLVECWGGQDSSIPGFLEFIYDSILPACFMAPLKPTFDLNDGQTSLALGECALCLKSVLEKRGEECISYLQREYLPKLQMSPEQTQEFCQALQSESKLFRAFFKSFFLKAKS